ncbi:MAG: sensor histidine kinase N-terminal domain-containing protein [Advenella sp.]|uniref:histidine kinase n=1 Tax=Advenella kashmirensis TaxID=310575 RepID=A0A356LG40_9BURK|nr:sensor histidine kinase [Advenella kashmirensis]
MKLFSRSLKSILLWLLVPALLLTMLTALGLSSKDLRKQITVAYDRSLVGALNSLNHNISTESGGLSLEQPYTLLEFYELTANADVFFKIAADDGLSVIGNADLPMPEVALESGKAYFFDTDYLGEPVRSVVMAREAVPPLYGDKSVRIIIQVAEGIGDRESFINRMLWRSVGRDLLLIAVVMIIVIVGIIFAVRPLERLRYEMRSRTINDLRPVSTEGMPKEVKPLVNAINQHMQRYTEQADRQRQFLDDASHQLKTPLAVLKTQLDYALRESDPQEVREVLLSMNEGVDRAIRMTSQMLALARVRDSLDTQVWQDSAPVNLGELVNELVRDLWPVIRERRIDLEVIPSDTPLYVRGVAWLLQEALRNVLDNAIRYCPRQGAVAISLERQDDTTVQVVVEDSGAGMSEEDRQKAGIRFRRGKAGKHLPGAGLGLAIVSTILQMHQARMVLEPGVRLKGLRVRLVFTLNLTP